MATAVFANHCDGVQRRELGRLGTAIKQSQINGFEHKELRYHVHVCPEASSVTPVGMVRQLQPQQ